MSNSLCLYIFWIINHNLNQMKHNLSNLNMIFVRFEYDLEMIWSGVMKYRIYTLMDLRRGPTNQTQGSGVETEYWNPWGQSVNWSLALGLQIKFCVKKSKSGKLNLRTTQKGSVRRSSPQISIVVVQLINNLQAVHTNFFGCFFWYFDCFCPRNLEDFKN